MTKRVLYGLFLLVALGALGLILAGALTTGEQLLVRFLTAVIVAGLGLYVISDLRLQATDKPTSPSRSSLAPVSQTAEGIPRDSTAAFMATVTGKKAPTTASLDARWPDNTDLEADGHPMVTFERDPEPTDSVPAVDADRAGADEPSDAPQPERDGPDLGVFATAAAGTDDGPSPIAAAETRHPAPVTAEIPRIPDPRPGPGPGPEHRPSEPVIDRSLTDTTAAEEAAPSLVEQPDPVPSMTPPVPTGDAIGSGLTIDLTDDADPYRDDIEAAAAWPYTGSTPTAEDASPGPSAVSPLDEADGDGTEVAPFVIEDSPIDLREPANHFGPTDGVDNGEVAPFVAEEATIDLRDGEDDDHDDHDDRPAVPAAVSVTADGQVEDATPTATPSPLELPELETDGPTGSDPDPDGVDDVVAADYPARDEPGPGDVEGLVIDLVGPPPAADDDLLAVPMANGSPLPTADDELLAAAGPSGTPLPIIGEPEPEPATPGAADEPALDNPVTDPATDDRSRSGAWRRSAAIDRARAEIEAAAYARNGIIDLRSEQDPADVESAIRSGERNIITALVNDGVLSAEGPISDRDVRTMIYVAFTSSELRKLILTGGTIDGVDADRLGPVEVFTTGEGPAMVNPGDDTPELEPAAIDPPTSAERPSSAESGDRTPAAAEPGTSLIVESTVGASEPDSPTHARTEDRPAAVAPAVRGGDEPDIDLVMAERAARARSRPSPLLAAALQRRSGDELGSDGPLPHHELAGTSEGPNRY